MKSTRFIRITTAALSAAIISACGGGGGGGGVAANAGSTVAGTIAGFGSIIMSNGLEYNTDGVSTCQVDDLGAPGKCEDSLAVGMNVVLQVDSSGAVTSVQYDDELEGPAANVGGMDGDFTFEVFGASVATTNPGTQWAGFTTNPPTPVELAGANVEVSGEWQGTTLNATYVEKQSDATHEAKGTVGMVAGSTFPLTLAGGTVITVDASGANQVPVEGNYVEVEGVYDANTNTFTATKVELEDEDHFDSDGEAEITGTLVLDTGSSTRGSIGSTDVDISNAPTCNGLDGSVVEAEGTYDQASSVLIVRKCEDEDDELEMKCDSGNVSVDGNMPKAGSVDCTFPNTTGGPLQVQFRDAPKLAVFSDDNSMNPFDLNNVSQGDCVEMKASKETASGDLVAGLLQLEDAAMSCDSYKLKGPVDGFTDNVSITVLGITFVVDGTTSYPDGKPVPGDNVKITDETGNGIADEVEIKS